jgi:hypothetical protein
VHDPSPAPGGVRDAPARPPDSAVPAAVAGIRRCRVRRGRGAGDALRGGTPARPAATAPSHSTPSRGRSGPARAAPAAARPAPGRPGGDPADARRRRRWRRLGRRRTAFWRSDHASGLVLLLLRSTRAVSAEAEAPRSPSPSRDTERGPDGLRRGDPERCVASKS